ncbi:Uncharacterised protein [Mycobacteroides abscessus]|nr:Uncharacterised protein [Mycobacteroides abscessus]
MVPTVERGLRFVDFWSIETAGDRPSMKSTSGLSIWPRNWRAYADSDSTYRRCPSAKMVSKASDDLPEPESPVKTMSLSRGRSRSTLRRLCSRAPEMTRRLLTAASYGRPPTLAQVFDVTSARHPANAHERPTSGLSAVTRVTAAGVATHCPLRADGTLGA